MMVVLKVIHLYALIIGAVGGMGTAVLMAKADGPPSGQVVAVLGLFRKFGVWGVIVLWITGSLMVAVKYGTLALGTAFYVKLAAATAMLLLILGSAQIAAKARAAGTPPNGALMSKLGQLSAVAAFVAIVCAVIVFH